MNILNEASKDKTSAVLHMNVPYERNDAVNIMKYYDIDPQWAASVIYVPYNGGSSIYRGKIARIILGLDDKKNIYIKGIALGVMDDNISTKDIVDADKIFTVEDFQNLITRQKELEYTLNGKKLNRLPTDPIERSYETQRTIDGYNYKLSPKAYASRSSNKVPESFIEQTLIQIAENLKEKLKIRLVTAGLEYKKNHSDASKEELFNFFNKAEAKILSNAGIPIHPDLFLKTYREHNPVDNGSIYLEKLLSKHFGDDYKYIPYKGRDGEILHRISTPISGEIEDSGKKMNDLLNKYKNQIETQGKTDDA